mgnify:FL=1
MYGYNGFVLLVDLNKERWDTISLSQEILRKYIGGTGLAAWLLYQHCPEGIDPYHPDNPLIFCTSPLVGTQLTTSSKFAVATKSPLTGFIGDSMSSSFLATELKATGFDAVVIKGAADKWKFVSVSETGVRFYDGSDLIGLTTSETESHLKSELGEDQRIACIGPAGENLVRYATISNDGGRQAGRTGTGAVMGSKKLKAISFRGSSMVESAEEESLRARRIVLSRKSIGQATEKYRNMGTMANTAVFNRLGTLPSLNFRKGSIKNIDEFSGESIHQQTKVKKAHCANCTIGCEKLVEIPNSDGQRTRLEYQSAFALGPLVGLSDRESMLRDTRFCDEMGIDSISAGVTIAWYLECVEKDLIKDDEIGEMGTKTVSYLLQKIAYRAGVGDKLAEGTAKASESIARESRSFAMHVKGLEMPGYEPRALKSMALALAVSTRGACHNRSSAYEHDFSESGNRFEASFAKGAVVADGEDYSAVMDSLIWCKFVRKVFDDFYSESAEVINEITGWDMTADELRKCGERINNLKKLFNIREGWEGKDDTLPERILTEPLDNGARLSGLELGMMIKSYYQARGWTEEGYIPQSKCDELDLNGLSEINGAKVG